MIVGITGHRKFGGKFDNKEIESKLLYRMVGELERLSATKVISGMALGTDQIAARAAYQLNIPVIAAVPFAGQEAMWREEAKLAYSELLGRAAEVVIVSTGGYADWKMHARNKYIVNNSDEMIAVLSPSSRSGGTVSCVEFAKAWKKKIHYVNPDLLSS